jgi:hypothetical protein
MRDGGAGTGDLTIAGPVSSSFNCVDALDIHRITTYRFVQRAKHRAVVVTHRGEVTTVIFPFSGSDWRGPRNVIATLRHALGLIGGAP